MHHSIVDQLQQYVSYDMRQADQCAWWILERVTGLSQAQLFVNTILLNEDQKKLLTKILENICVYKMPLQYALGSVEFGSLQLRVRQPVLIPRLETEEWVYVVRDFLLPFKDKKLIIADVCAGSGCIGLFLAKELPNAHVYLLDISLDAIALTQENARLNNVTNITIVQSDLFESLNNEIKFDVVVSNPPYVTFDEFEQLDDLVKMWESETALIADDQGLAIIKKLIDNVKKRLKKDSCVKKNTPRFFVEIGHKQGKIVANYLINDGYVRVNVWKDIQAKDRVVWACIENEFFCKEKR